MPLSPVPAAGLAIFGMLGCRKHPAYVMAADSPPARRPVPAPRPHAAGQPLPDRLDLCPWVETGWRDRA